MDSKKIREYSKDWYTMGRTFLPPFETPRFAAVAGSANSFTYEVWQKSDKPVKIQLTKELDTAAVDMEKNIIYLSDKYFSSELYKGRFDEDHDLEELAIALINGSVIHEALHLRWTNSGWGHDIAAIAENAEDGRLTIDRFGAKAVYSMVNIVEDIFIEARVPRRLERWLQATSDILFPERLYDRDFDLNDIAHIVNLIVLYKNKEMRHQPVFEQLPAEVLEILELAAGPSIGMKSPVDRAQAACDILNIFWEEWGADDESEDDGDGAEADGSEAGSSDSAGEGSEDGAEADTDEITDEDDDEVGDEDDDEAETDEVTGEDDDTDEEDSGEGEGDGDGDGSSREVDDATADDELDRGSKGKAWAGALSEILDEIEGLDPEDFDRMSEELEAIAKEVSDALVDEKKYSAGYDTVSWTTPVTKDVLDVAGYSPTIEPVTKIDFSFLKELQAIRTLNRTPGAARTRGSVMVKSRLTRIATDGKIFAKRDAQRRQNKRVEVIINVDLSGSTYGHVVNNEVGAAKAMSKTLMSAGIPHSVYGHTSTRRNRPLIIRIFSFQMKENDSNWKERFEKSERLALCQNFDGVVINELAEAFTDREAQKFLINLSDGRPAAPGYSGQAADDHTRKAIEAARNKGIGVFAISVVSHVVSANNALYGKEYNIDGSRNLNQQFRDLIKKLAS